MLSHILNTEEYALCLTPGFFRFYAHVGILHALEECDLLKPRYVTGSSAGALVGGFLAAGKFLHIFMLPSNFSSYIFTFI